MARFVVSSKGTVVCLRLEWGCEGLLGAMNAVHMTSRSRGFAPFFVQLQPLTSEAGTLWTVKLEPEILTLMNPANQDVLQLHREEAARYINFAHDLRRGRVIHFVIIEGLKSYSFRCAKVQLLKLLAWMPHKDTEEIERDVRRSGIVLGLLGLLNFLVAQRMWMGMGVVIMLVGLFAYFRPHRKMFAVNGALLLATGLWDLTTWSFAAAATPSDGLGYSIIPMTMGIVLILWGIQQITLLGPNHQVRIARELRDERASLMFQPSVVVRRIAWVNAVTAALFFSYSVVLLAHGVYISRSAVAPPPFSWLTPDLVVFGVSGLLSASSSLVLLRKQRPAYMEARVCAQVMISVLVFGIWGALFSIVTGSSFSFFGDVVYTTHVIFAPAVWLTLIAAVAMFNRWYGRSVDNELESQRN